MRRKLFWVGMAWRLLVALILALCLVPITSNPVVALSGEDYFTVSYDATLDDDKVYGDEVFHAILTGQATCIKALPSIFTPSEAFITGCIIAEHKESGIQVTLNSSYTVSISSFPREEGDIVQESQTVPLQFPAGSQSGTYSVIAQLIEAKARFNIFGWIDVRSLFPSLPSSQTMGSVTYTAPGGGGGGGFGPALTPTGEELKTNLFGIEAISPISPSGEILEAIEATSEDGMLTLTIPGGTIALDKDDNPLSTLTVELDLDPPDPPAEAHIIGIPYKLGPPGTTFSPPIAIEFTVDPATLPPGVAVEDLVVAYYDEEAGEWIELDCVVDTENNTITASIEHFTTFAIIGVVTSAPESEPEVPVAVFRISELDISPSEVDIGQTVTISLLVANTGGKSGSYKVTLKINGVVAATKEVTVSAGLSKEVTFAIPRDIAGTYSVDVNGLTDSFTVKEKEAAVIPTPSTPSTLPPAKPINWPVVGGVVAALVAMGSLLFFLARRSHTKSS